MADKTTKKAQAAARRPPRIAHEPLWDVWQRRKAEDRTITQKELALLWGVTEGAVSQYLRGHTALNLEAQLRFAQFLEVPITAIWPDFQFRDMCPGKLPPKAVIVATDWANIQDIEQQDHFASLIRAAAKRK